MSRQIPAVEGWFSDGSDGGEPHLLGHRCTACGTYAFPFRPLACPRPGCASLDLEPAPLSRGGRIWSFTDARYAPPAPYVAGAEHTPFALAAVELAEERMVVLGQVASGFTVDDLAIGQEVTLVVEPLYQEADGTERTVWRWRPVDVEPSAPPAAVPVLESTP